MPSDRGEQASATGLAAPEPVRRRWLRRLAATAAVLLGILVVAGAVAVRRADALLLGQARAVAATWSAKLGRPIAIGRAHVALAATVAVELDDLVVGAPAGQSGPAAEPLLTVGTIRLGLAAWPLLFSLGRDVQVRFVDVEAPKVTLVRGADGRLSIEDVRERLATASRPPRLPAEQAELRTLRLGPARVHGGALVLHDLARGGDRLALEAVDAETPGGPLTGPLAVSLDVAVLSATHNLHAELVLEAPIAGEPAKEGESARPPPPLRRLAVTLAPTLLDPLLRFAHVPAEGPALRLGGRTLFKVPLAEARLGGELTVDTAEDPRWALTLKAEATGLALADPETGARGEVAPLRLGAAVSVDVVAAKAEVTALELGAGEMSLRAAFKLPSLLGAVEVRDLSLRSEGLTFERLLALVPQGRRPQGVSLAGPLAVRLEGTAAAGRAELAGGVELRGATLRTPWLLKPAGTALSAEGKVAVSEADGLVVSALELALGPLAAHVEGRARSAEEVEVPVVRGHLDVSPLLSLLPVIHLPPATRAAGKLTFAGGLSRKGAKTEAHGEVSVRDAAFEARGGSVAGAAHAKVSVRTEGAATALELDADLTGAHLHATAGVDKPAGMALTLSVAAQRSGQELTFRKASLTLPGASVQAHGTTHLASHRTTLEVPACDLDLGRLAALSDVAGAAIPPGLAGGRVRFGLHLEGDPADLGAATLSVRDLDVRGPLGHVAGSFAVTGLDRPSKVTFALQGEALDLDRLGPRDARTAARGGPVSPGAADADAAGPGPGLNLGALLALRKLELDGTLRLGALHAGKLDARDVTADLSAAKGVVTVKVLRLAAFGGVVDLGGTRLDVGGFVPRAELAVRVEHLDLARLVIDPAREARGTLDLQAHVQGGGLTPEGFASSLSGKVALALSGFEIRSGFSPHVTIVNAFLAHLAALAPGPKLRPPEKVALKEASASFEVRDGRAFTDAPLRTVTEQGTLELTGSVGFDRTLDLTGALTIPPEVIVKATSGKVAPSGPVPVHLHLTGTAPDVHLELRSLGETLEPFLGSRLRGALQSALPPAAK